MTTSTFTESKPWRVLRWVPLGTLLLSAAALLVAFALGGMARVMAWYLTMLVPPLLGLLTVLVVGIYAAIRRRWTRPIWLSMLVGGLMLIPVAMNFVPLAYPASLESTQPAVAVRLPADVPLQVAWGGDKIETNYHVVSPDQRWAYDLVVEPYFHGSGDVEDYGCYGVPVLAPAAGEVIAAHDGEPDATPGVLSNNFVAPTGNWVGIQLAETGTYLVIAHLKPGSVAVAVGETVAEGQLIGECGNSGNTSEPHIHIHHQAQDPNVFPLNFAVGLPLYFRDHDGPAMPVGGYRLEGETAIATGDLVQHIGDD